MARVNRPVVRQMRKQYRKVIADERQRKQLAALRAKQVAR